MAGDNLMGDGKDPRQRKRDISFEIFCGGGFPLGFLSKKILFRIVSSGDSIRFQFLVFSTFEKFKIRIMIDDHSVVSSFTGFHSISYDI